MTLYRHFASKDELVAAYLRCLAEKASASWDKLAAQHAGDPRAQLRAWLENMAGHVDSGDQRGCALSNAAVEMALYKHAADGKLRESDGREGNQHISTLPKLPLVSPNTLSWRHLHATKRQRQLDNNGKWSALAVLRSAIIAYAV